MGGDAMKVLLCHNFYQQRGGEDQVFADEGLLLESHGHQVVRYTRHNDDIHQQDRLTLAAKTVWNRRTQADLSEIIAREAPDVMHCANTFPLISPSAYYTARSHGVAVVQTLHNYRLLCPKGTFLRDGAVCEKCVHTLVPWPAVVHACYRDDRAASAVVGGMLSLHRLMKTWTGAVDKYIALTEFSRNKFIEGGLPAEQIHVKPNFVSPEPEAGAGNGGYALFVGRLAPEKGIDAMLSAWAKLSEAVPLKIVGDGPLSDCVKQAATDDTRIEWLGTYSLEKTLSIMREAEFLLMPSIWYETFGRTIVEAFATGTPVIASRMGAMAELVDDGLTGLHFEPGDPVDLAEKVTQLWNDSTRRREMRAAARCEFERQYTAETNYQILMEIYEQAIDHRARKSGTSAVQIAAGAE
jgi:glycosyltransferase involved in cell wall biosynthesis